MERLRLLLLSGSVRQGSLTLRLAQAGGALARERGAEVRLFDLRGLDLPLYDGDIEASQGVPRGAHLLRDAVLGSDALLIATPEYNGFPTPLVINAFDWLSRLIADATHPSGLAATAGRPAGLLSASPGPAGGLRSMNFLRQYLQMAFQMVVAPQQYALGRAGDAFDEAGVLNDPRAAAGVVDGLLALAGRLRTPI